MGEIKDREACTADFALQRNLVTLNVTLIFFFFTVLPESLLGPS